MSIPDVEITPRITIPGWELWTTTSRSSGAGGQHVNTTNSRVTLHWVPANSSVLSDAEKARVSHRLANRISRDGVLQLHVESERSQFQNQAEALERFAELLARALHVQATRVPTRTPHWARMARLTDKHVRSEVKATRKRPGDPD
jgi:ribosome-associated protein